MCSSDLQYWTNPAPVDSFADFVSGASETPGSWWPHWMAWLRGQGSHEVPAKGKRKPGGKSDAKGDSGFEDAPGSYVKAR